MASDSAHWDAVYGAARADEVSWYEREPTVSLELIERLGVEPSIPVVDIGGGMSPLGGELVRLGFEDVTVLDVSDVALAAGRRRAEGGDAITWVCSDVRRWRPARRYGLWHDRACLHFLTAEADRSAYLHTLQMALEPGGAVVIGTFADDGPTTCSGLPIERYAPEKLVALLGTTFEAVEVRTSRHLTPWGAEQPFAWVAARQLRSAGVETQ